MDALYLAYQALKKGLSATGFSVPGIMEGIASWLASALANALNSFFAPIFTLITNPLSFDFAANLTLGFQGAALIMVFFLVVARGITRGIVGSATDDDMDLVHYLYRSLVPMGAVILAPTIASMAAAATSHLVSVVSGGAALSSCCSSLATMLVKLAGAGSAGGFAIGVNATGILFSLVMSVVVITKIFSLAIEILKRWVELAMISIAIPLTAVTVAVGDDKDLITAVKTLVGTGVVIVLQILLLASGAAVAAAGAAANEVMGPIFVVIALFSAAKNLPQWIDKFTYAGSVSGTGSAARTFVYAGSRAATSAVRAVKAAR